MRKISLFLLFAAVSFAQSIPGIPGTGWHMMGGTSTLAHNVMLRYKTEIVRTDGRPAPAGTSFSKGAAWGVGNTINRALVDNLRGTYFGYSMVFECDQTGKTFVASFQPLGASELPKFLTAGAVLKLSAPPKFPKPQTVHDGDMIELDLLVSPDGKQKLTDYVEILTAWPVPPAPKSTSTPVDFTLDDGPVSFDTFGMTILHEGQPVWGTSFTGILGSTLWFAVPGQGRYILSLTSHDGFKKAGSIRDNTIFFKAASEQYEWRFMSPIAGEGKAWNLYVLHDATYEPVASRKNYVHAGSGRLDKLLPKPDKNGDIL